MTADRKIVGSKAATNRTDLAGPKGTHRMSVEHFAAWVVPSHIDPPIDEPIAFSAMTLKMGWHGL